MTRIELAPKVMDDIERTLERLARYQVVDSPLRIQEIIQAISVLEHNPLIGRVVNKGMRELVIGYQARGYVALYRYIPISTRRLCWRSAARENWGITKTKRPTVSRGPDAHLFHLLATGGV